VDPLEQAGAAIDGEPPATVEGDPAAIVDLAVEEGSATSERPREEVAPEVRALVQHWWQRTSETADFSAAVARQEKDFKAIDGGSATQIADAATSTVQHIYRNAIQTVAMLVPPETGYRWKPWEIAEPVPGMQEPPELVEWRQRTHGLGNVVTALWRRFGKKSNIQEKVEAWIQDAVHHRVAVLKIWWQSDLARDPISNDRLPDEQDQLARLRVMIEGYDHNEFCKGDAQYQQMRDLMRSLGVSELDVHRGLVVETVPLGQYRIDPTVTGPEHKAQAEWERQDLLMTRDQVLAKFDNIHPDDLQEALTYDVDEQGRWIKSAQEERTATNRSVQPNDIGLRSTGELKGDDWLLVAEIYDYGTNTRLVLVEGLAYPAVDEPLVKQPAGNSPYVVLVLNRRSGSFYGFSDTELQDKTQEARNRMREDEEQAREDARPRWAYNPGIINDPKVIEAISNAKGGDMVPVPLAPSEDLSKALVPLAGNHEFNPVEFDDSKLAREQDKMAMMPEQALGVTGSAEFAEEVKAATAGGTALARYRQTRINRALAILADKAAQLILMHCPQELAVRLAGPMAAIFYPPQPLDRQTIYEGLDIEVEVALDRQLDMDKRMRLLVQWAEIMGKMGVRFDAQTAGVMLGRLLNMGEDAKGLIMADPNDLVARLMAAIQEGKIPLAPETMAALAQAGAMAQQQLVAAMAQQEAEKAAAGGAPPAQGPPAQPPIA
jgi:hypothetical protein